MKEFYIKFREIFKEVLSLLKREFQRLYKLSKDKLDFTLKKQKTIKKMLSPLIEKREASLKALNQELITCKKETKSLSSEIDKNLALSESLDREISILSE